MRRLAALAIVCAIALLVNISYTVASTTPQPSSKRSKKKRTSSNICSASATAFAFDERPPAERHDMRFCQQYRGETCCAATHTNTILRTAYAYYEPDDSTAIALAAADDATANAAAVVVADDDGDAAFVLRSGAGQPQRVFSDECRTLASKVLCSPCDPLVGTARVVGVCAPLCDQWYSACKDSLYTVQAGAAALLAPCARDSLVCAPLRDIVATGASFCERSGFAVTPSAAAAAARWRSRPRDPFAVALPTPVRNADVTVVETLLYHILFCLCHIPFFF
jgi:hypothetical protein